MEKQVQLVNGATDHLGGFGFRLTHLFLSLFEEKPEPFVFLNPGWQLSLALLPCLLQLCLQLPQHMQLLRQPGLPRPGDLQVQF